MQGKCIKRIVAVLQSGYIRKFSVSPHIRTFQYYLRLLKLPNADLYRILAI